MLAVLRPDDWNGPLFLHLLGAFALVGGLLAVAVATLAPRRLPETGALLDRLAFRTLLVVAWPGFVVMRVAGQWLESKEDVPGDPTWLGIGFLVSDLGALLLLVLTVLAWRAARRPATAPGARPATSRAVAVLTPVYLLALAVAWWAMSTKPGA
jgi:hypothetical protein